MLDLSNNMGNKSVYEEIGLCDFNVIYEGSDTLPIRAASFSPDGQYLTVGSNSRIMNVYSLENIIQNYVRIIESKNTCI
jgi:WD40 repeat protein